MYRILDTIEIFYILCVHCIMFPCQVTFLGESQRKYRGRFVSILVTISTKYTPSIIQKVTNSNSYPFSNYFTYYSCRRTNYMTV
jgi:hypothetical protein